MSTPVFFFVATAGEALTLDLPAELDLRPVVRSKNITPDMVGDLDFLLTGEREREPVCLREEENLVVFRLDDELVDSLATLDDGQMPEIADEWGIADTAGTMAFLSELRQLAQTANNRGEEVFLCF
ncbi:MAG: hypothetical protein WD669_06200 [Pirellulales bacterium]